MESIIVGLIIAAAGAFAVYRLFFRPGCGCGSGCACETRGQGRAGREGDCQGHDGPCNCGK